MKKIDLNEKYILSYKWSELAEGLVFSTETIKTDSMSVSYDRCNTCQRVARLKKSAR